MAMVEMLFRKAPLQKCRPMPLVSILPIKCKAVKCKKKPPSLNQNKTPIQEKKPAENVAGSWLGKGMEGTSMRNPGTRANKAFWNSFRPNP